MSDKKQCFTISVDGKVYGPFLHDHRPKVSKLENLKGMIIANVWTDKWVEFTPPPAKRVPKDRTTPLLDGIGFLPVPRQRYAPDRG